MPSGVGAKRLAVFEGKQEGTLSISEQLKAAIEASGQTVHAVAVGSGVDAAVVQCFMSGAVIRLEKTADRLAAYLGLELVKPKSKVKPRQKKE